MSGEECPGCLILLVDESAAMESPCQDGKESLIGNQPKRKTDAIAATLNSLIRQLSGGTNFDVALVGYHSEADGTAVARSCWGGELAGRDFVPLVDLAAHPVTVEKRPRKLPDPTSLTGFREEIVDFPIWYSAQCSGGAPQIKAFQHCQAILTAWQAEQTAPFRTPLILHIFAGGSSDGNPFKAVNDLQNLPSKPLVFQAHLCVSEHVPATLYAASRSYVSAGPSRDLFDRCSVLSAPLASFLKSAKIAIGANARGMVYNGRMTDIVQFLALSKEHTRDWPAKSTAVPPVPETPVVADVPSQSSAESTPADVAPPVDLAPIDLGPIDLGLGDLGPVGELDLSAPLVDETPPKCTDKAACILFLLDRSVADPFSGNTQSSWSRLQDHANALLAKIAKSSAGVVETGVVSYGTDSMGTLDVRQTFEGPLSGKVLVTSTELAEGPIRIDEIEQQESDGVGGLMTITLKKKIYVELDPTTAASPVPAFEAAREILSEFGSRHPEACVPPIVVHLTRGEFNFDELSSAWDALNNSGNGAGAVVGYHIVTTEEPHSAAAYPVDDSGLQTDALKNLFAKSSVLFGVEGLEIAKPKLVRTASRGMAVNCKFDFLMEGITEAFGRC